MVSTKHIKSKIHSIKSVRSISYALKSSASVLLKKLKAENNGLLEYVNTVNDIAKSINWSKYYEKSEKNKSITLVFSSDKGLCGNVNNLISREFKKHYMEGEQVYFIGRKAYQNFVFNINNGNNIELILNNKKPSIEFAKEIYNIVSSYRHIRLIFNKCLSIFKYEPTIINTSDLEKSENINLCQSYEPDYFTLAANIEEKYKTSMILHALFESYLCFQSSRVISMENASNSASDMIKTLTYEYNKIRQESITSEIIEIVSAGDIISQ